MLQKSTAAKGAWGTTGQVPNPEHAVELRSHLQAIAALRARILAYQPPSTAAAAAARGMHRHGRSSQQAPSVPCANILLLGGIGSGGCILG